MLDMSTATVVRTCITTVACLAVVLTAATASAAGTTPTEAKSLPEGTVLIGERDFLTGQLQGPRYASMRRVTVDGMEFSDVIELNTFATPAQTYQAQYVVQPKGAIKKGDVILATFWARTVSSSDETGAGWTHIIYEGPNNSRHLSSEVAIGPEWRKFHRSFVAKEDLDAARCRFNFRIGTRPQVIQVAGLQVINYGNKVTLADMPVDVISYSGREPDAQWRKDALQRIEEHRTEEIVVVVKDRTGATVPNASVKVNMVRNEFDFGSAVNARYLVDGHSDSPRYQKEVKALFNTIAFENALKWETLERAAENRQRAYRALDWAAANGFKVIGHNLIWDAENYYPDSLPVKSMGKEELRKVILDHIQETVRLGKGKVAAWIVVNEPTKCNLLRSTVFDDTIFVEWFAAARAADPDAKLFVNETSITGTANGQVTAFIEILDGMVKNGVDFDGIGIQGHFGNQPPAMTNVVEQLNTFAAYGKELQITEFDIITDDERLAADFTRDYLIAAYSIPAIKGFQMWGFWDAIHWRGNSPIYDKQWRLKPAGQVWLDLVLNQWHTRESGTTDAAGAFRTRGHLGEYEVSVEVGEKRATVSAVVKKGADNTVTVVLD